MLSNAYFIAKFNFDTAENEPAKDFQNLLKTFLSYQLRSAERPAPLRPREVTPQTAACFGTCRGSPSRSRGCRRGSVAPGPEFSAESTPTGGWCQMEQASIKISQNFTNFHSFPLSANYLISDDFD